MKKTVILLSFSYTMLLFVACRESKNKNNRQVLLDTTSQIIDIGGEVTPYQKTIDSMANVSVADSVPEKENIFLQCLELSDTALLFEYLKEKQIVVTKIWFQTYASEEAGIEIYPKNKIPPSSIQRYKCGYFSYSTGDPAPINRIYIEQFNNELGQTTSSPNVRYVDPDVIGDTCMYWPDYERAKTMIAIFFRQARLGNKKKANQYILFPVVVNGKEMQADEFWESYQSTWKILDSKKAHYDFIAFGNSLYNMFSYDRQGIRYSKPDETSEDGYNDDGFSDYTCGYYMWWLSTIEEKGTRFERTLTYYMRVINVDGKAKICSFIESYSSGLPAGGLLLNDPDYKGD